ncbi:MAG: ABC transporter substrate-binding protein [bacterium]|nr:ABC transporter substrate-binding protein [bacterium]
MAGKRVYIAFLAVLLVLPVLRAVPVSAEGVFRFPLFYVPASLDPVRDELIATYHVVQQVYDGLVAFDSNLRVMPGLAESWTVSRDGRSYQFTLRKGVRFHDGSLLTADDVVASLTRIFGPGSQTGSRKALYKIEGTLAYREGRSGAVTGIRTEGPGKVSITLTEPYAAFLSVLAMPITKIVPRKMAEDPRGTLGRLPVGTGPFRFDSWKEGMIVLKANESYFGGRPSLDEVRFVFYPGEERERAFPDFLEGKLEGCPLPGNADLDELREQGYQVLVRPRISIMFYGMNTRTPPLDDPGVRMALARGFNRERYVEEVLHSKHIPAAQIVPPGMPGYSPANALLTYDRDGAVRRLAESRYPGGTGMPELAVASVSHSEAAKAELEMFRQDMAAIGIRIRPLFVDTWEEFKEGIEKGRYPLYRYALYADIPDPEDFLPNLAQTGAAHNFTGYTDPAVDSLIEKARGETDPVKRISLYRDAERRVLENPPLIPIIFISTQVAFQGNVRNIDLPATGTPYLPLHRITLVQAP